jgi:hypothetical protein
MSRGIIFHIYMKMHRAMFTSVFLAAFLSGDHAFAFGAGKSIFPFGHMLLIFASIALIASVFLVVMLLIEGYEKLSGMQKGIAIVLSLIVICVAAYSFIIKYTHLLELEVNDEYIAGLFTPGVPYETLRVKHSIDGKKYVVIEMKGEVTQEIFDEYRNGLLSRGITVSGYGATMTRKAEDDPDAIELYEPRLRDHYDLFRGREIRILMDKDTGWQWRRVRIIPEKEPQTIAFHSRYPEVGLMDILGDFLMSRGLDRDALNRWLNSRKPRDKGPAIFEILARYPGARLRDAYMDEDGNVRWIYAVRGASLKEVYHFYADILGESIKIDRLQPVDPDSPGRDCFDKEMFKYSRHGDSKIITMSRCVYIRASYDESRRVEIYIMQSRDPNLDDFTEITVFGHIGDR